jgi:hypothetical protein
MWLVSRESRIHDVVFRLLGRLTMLQWRPRLIALAVVLVLLLLAFAGAYDDLGWLNLYW